MSEQRAGGENEMMLVCVEVLLAESKDLNVSQEKTDSTYIR